MSAAVLTETKSTGTPGGSSVAASWIPRNLNVIAIDSTVNWCTLGTGGQFTLKTGKYLITASAVGVGVGSHQLRLKNVTDVTYSYGMSSLSSSLYPSNSGLATFATYISVGAQRTFALEHYFEQTFTNFGMGVPTNVSGNTEIYATVVIQRV
jgi:hypothetical protein